MAKYEVIGNHAVAGVSPGGVVELPDDQAEQLIAGGHVRPKRRPAPVKTDAVPEPADEGDDA